MLHVGPVLLIGVVLFVAMWFQQIGLQTTSVTNSRFFTGLYVVFTPLLGIALRQAATRPRMSSSTLSVVDGAGPSMGSPLSSGSTRSNRSIDTMSAVRYEATRVLHESITCRLEPVEKNVVSGPSNW